MKFLLSLSLIFITINMSFAQATWIEGTIVKRDGTEPLRSGVSRRDRMRERWDSEEEQSD